MPIKSITSAETLPLVMLDEGNLVCKVFECPLGVDIELNVVLNSKGLFALSPPVAMLLTDLFARI